MTWHDITPRFAFHFLECLTGTSVTERRRATLQSLSRHEEKKQQGNKSSKRTFGNGPSTFFLRLSWKQLLAPSFRLSCREESYFGVCVWRQIASFNMLRPALLPTVVRHAFQTHDDDKDALPITIAVTLGFLFGILTLLVGLGYYFRRRRTRCCRLSEGLFHGRHVYLPCELDPFC